MVISEFEWDAGNWPKCGKHGVSKAEIEFVLSHEPMVWPAHPGQDGETRLSGIGRGEAGRYLFAVFTIRAARGKALIRPLSARYMHQTEIEHYERSKGT